MSSSRKSILAVVVHAIADLLADRAGADRLVAAGRDRFDALGLNSAANHLVEAVQALANRSTIAS